MSYAKKQASRDKNEDKYIVSPYPLLIPVNAKACDLAYLHSSNCLRQLRVASPSRQPKESQGALIGEASNLTIGQCGENIVYGNEQGHRVKLRTLEEHGESLIEQRKPLKELRKALESHQEEHNQTKRQLKFLNSLVDTLRQLSQGYMCIRTRFFVVYRRDIKHLKEYSQPRQSEAAILSPTTVMLWGTHTCSSVTKGQIAHCTENFMALLQTRCYVIVRI